MEFPRRKKNTETYVDTYGATEPAPNAANARTFVTQTSGIQDYGPTEPAGSAPSSYGFPLVDYSDVTDNRPYVPDPPVQQSQPSAADPFVTVRSDRFTSPMQPPMVQDTDATVPMYAGSITPDPFVTIPIINKGPMDFGHHDPSEADAPVPEVPSYVDYTYHRDNTEPKSESQFVNTEFKEEPAVPADPAPPVNFEEKEFPVEQEPTACTETVPEVPVTEPVPVASLIEADSPLADPQPVPTTDVVPVVGWLVCVKGANKGQEYRIHEGYNYIGSVKGDLVIAGDPRIAPENHMAITYSPKTRRFYVSPGIGGMSLIYLNDEDLAANTRAELNSFDLLETGTSVFLFIALCGDRFSWEDTNHR